MADLSDLGRDLRRQASPPPSLEDLDRRARRRRNRRGSKAVVAVTAVIVVLGGAVLLRDRDQPVAAASLTITPSSGLRTGDLVEFQITGDLHPDDVSFVAECPSEVIDMAYIDVASDDEILARCTAVLEAPGLSSAVEVMAVIDTPDGPVDCRASAGRCVIAARVPGGMQSSSLWFADDGPDAALTIDAVASLGGARVSVSGSGVRAGEPLEVLQCHDTPAAAELSCDQARVQVILGERDGTFRTESIAYEDIFTYGPGNAGWGRCDPCVISVRRRSDQARPVSAPIPGDVRPDPTRPTTVLLGSRREGEMIVFTLQGEGYQPRERPMIGLCRQPTPLDQASCALPSYPSFAGGIVTDDAGRFESDWYLPWGSFITNGGDYCGAEALPCVLGTQPFEGADLVAVTPVPKDLPQ